MKRYIIKILVASEHSFLFLLEVVGYIFMYNFYFIDEGWHDEGPIRLCRLCGEIFNTDDCEDPTELDCQDCIDFHNSFDSGASSVICSEATNETEAEQH